MHRHNTGGFLHLMRDSLLRGPSFNGDHYPQHRAKPVSRRPWVAYVLSVLIARSSSECHLYIELHPCACGETKLDVRHRLVSFDAGLGAVYEAPCPRCGVHRKFEFLLDPEIPPGDKFGGATASAIIDAGQYLAVADDAAKRVPADLSGLDDENRRVASWWMNRSVNALEEVIKAIPPGAEAVPETAMFSESGKAVYVCEPGRFRKSRLEAVLESYRELLRAIRNM